MKGRFPTDVIVLAAVTLLAAILRGIGLSAESFWTDEGWSLWVADQSPAAIVNLIRRADVHPPFYYLLLRGFTALFGTGEAGARALSAIFSTAAVPATWLLARRFLHRGPALLAALLMAVLPFQIEHAREARPYAFTGFLGLAATAAFLRLLDGRRDIATRIVYVAAIALGVATIHLAILVPAAHVLAFALHRLRGGTTPLRLPGLLWGVSAALVIPLAPIFLDQVRRVAEDFWIASPDVESVVNALFDLAGGRRVWGWFPINALARFGLALLYVFALALGIRALLRGRHGAGLLLAIVLAPPLVELLVSLRRPVFAPRTLLWLSGPLTIFLAAGVEALHRAARPLGFVLALLLLGVSGREVLSHHRDLRKEDWRGVATALARTAAADDLILFVAAEGRVPFERYYDALGGRARRRAIPVDPDDFGLTRHVPFRVRESDIPHIAALVAPHSRVFLVRSHAASSDPDEHTLRTLLRSHREHSRTPFRHIDVLEFTSRLPR